MASADVYRQVADAAVAALGATYRFLDIDEVDDELAQGSDPFFVIEDLYGDERLRSIGAPEAACFEEVGTFAFLLFLPTDQTAQDARSICDVLRGVLRFARFAVPSGTLRLKAAHPATIANAHDGLWTRAEFEVDYSLHTNRAIA